MTRKRFGTSAPLRGPDRPSAIPGGRRSRRIAGRRRHHLRRQRRFSRRHWQYPKAPEKLALHVWSAYSPTSRGKGWSKIFHGTAREIRREKELLQQFVNETLGEYWTEDYQKRPERTDGPGRTLPAGTRSRGLPAPFAGVDTHDNRLECNVWGTAAAAKPGPSPTACSTAIPTKTPSGTNSPNSSLRPNSTMQAAPS